MAQEPKVTYDYTQLKSLINLVCVIRDLQISTFNLRHFKFRRLESGEYEVWRVDGQGTQAKKKLR